MCPFCISTVLGITAGTVTTAGVTALFAFTRRLGNEVAPLPHSEHEEASR